MIKKENGEVQNNQHARNLCKFVGFVYQGVQTYSKWAGVGTWFYSKQAGATPYSII